MEAAVPGFACAKAAKATATTDFCSLELEKNATRGKRNVDETTTFDQKGLRPSQDEQGRQDGADDSRLRERCPDFRLLPPPRARRGSPSAGAERVLRRGLPGPGACTPARRRFVSAEKLLEADRIAADIKGPASEITADLFFARDAARTPLLIQAPLAIGQVHAGARPADMRVAFFSPMPPSGAASPTTLRRWSRRCRSSRTSQVFSSSRARIDPRHSIARLYQIGNNGHHAFVYEQALEWPGVVVMHEANLHHLIAEITIKRGDWDAYMREVEYDGGPEAASYARRVRALEVGPDYEGVPMLRRILEAVPRRDRSQPFRRALRARSRISTGPVAVIPHGAWIPEADRMGFRHRLGLDAATPLIGVFGFLKPYKRIAESLRAFKRLLRVEPNAKMILVGEPHPEFPLHALIDSLGSEQACGCSGFTPIEDFVGYIAACDIVLNLRYPTVGESSGTLLRSLGLGRAVIVSDIGSFSEYPDEICLKVPVDAREEETLFEYLNLLVSRPICARRWASARASGWSASATGTRSRNAMRRFCEAVVEGREWTQPQQPLRLRIALAAGLAVARRARSTFRHGRGRGIARLCRDAHHAISENARASHLRARRTSASSRWARTCRSRRRCERSSATAKFAAATTGPPGKVDHKSVESESGEHFECDVDLFDAEKDRFPYEDAYFDTVLCCELIEHLPNDPMYMMAEINRILKPGGHLVLTTPNITLAARDLGDSAGLSSRILSRLHQAGGARREVGSAPRSRVRSARNRASDARLRVRDRPAGDRRVSRRAASRARVGAPSARDNTSWTRTLRGDGIYAVGGEARPRTRPLSCVAV